jgi:hypothetical protein
VVPFVKTVSGRWATSPVIGIYWLTCREV